MFDIGSTVPAPSARHPRRHGGLAWIVGAMAFLGIGSVCWILVDSMNPAADVHATLWIDLDRIAIGERRTVRWRGIPIFVAHRTAEEIAGARADDGAEMPFPEKDADRVQREDWLIVIGLDTFHGWDFLDGQGEGDWRGDWGGWYDDHQNTHYDTAGRLRRGPGTANLIVPGYRFVSDSRIEISWPIEELSGLP